MHLIGSYGSLARFKDIQRLHSVGNYTVVGAGGDLADFQYIQNMLDSLIVDEITSQDDHTLSPSEIHEYLANVMYGRRSKMDPLWNALLVGGFKDGEKYLLSIFSARFHQPNYRVRFLAFVDLLGTTYKASTLATGYGAHIAQPLLRKAVEGRENTLTEEEALEILETSMKVLFYRDARSLNKV